MSPAGVSSAEALKARALEARERFVASGTRIIDWANERGFAYNLVLEVLSGRRVCRAGESHRIAVALGIKEELPPPGAPLPDQADRLEGVRP